MRPVSDSQPLPGPLERRLTGREPLVWVVSADAALGERIVQLLRARVGPPRLLTPQAVGREEFWTRLREKPRLIVLDLGTELDWGRAAIRRARRARVEAPVVVMAEAFSRDFGAKIISEGVRYHLLRQFCDQEFLSVIESLLRLREQSVWQQPAAGDTESGG